MNKQVFYLWTSTLDTLSPSINDLEVYLFKIVSGVVLFTSFKMILGYLGLILQNPSESSFNS